MKKLHSIAVCALMAPVMTLGIGSALAQAPPTVTEPAQEQKQRAQEQQQQRALRGQAQKDRGMSTADRAQQQRRDAQRAQQRGDSNDTYLSSRPENSFRSDELIGTELKSQSGSETVGTISDLLIDEDGQIVAMISVAPCGFQSAGVSAVMLVMLAPYNNWTPR